ncbi:MAG: DUF1207 domain-containing protein [Planctomycetota bacterium]|nr:DUF1207 domain-containing protein [Planctomycetota bacterium]
MIRTLALIWLALLAALLQTTAQAQAPVIVENAPDIYPEPIDLDAWVDQQPNSWSGGGYGYGYGSGYDDRGAWWPSWNDLNPFAPAEDDYLADAALNAPWSWTLLPDELIYRPELASLHTARLALSALNIKGFDPVGLPGGNNWYWDSALGARVGIIRYGSPNGSYPQGFQFDVEGAVFPRVDSDGSTLIATDYRLGLPMSFGWRRYQTKFGFYHVSSHMGDEYLINTGPAAIANRINYVTNSIVWGNSYQWNEAIRTYIDAAWAFNFDGGARPWQFQFGAEYSPICATGFRGSPFVAANGHILQALNWGGNIVLQVGWQWRAKDYGNLLRFGFQYLEGMTPRYEFFQNSERQLGLGLWYDF